MKTKLSDLRSKKEFSKDEIKEHLYDLKVKSVINDLPPEPPHVEYNVDDMLHVWDILKLYL